MLLYALSLALAAPTPQTAETLTNDTVIQLTQVGLGDQAIVAKIKGSTTSFKTSVSDLMDLKNRGVSGPVIAAMIDAGKPPVEVSVESPDPMVPHVPGVYLLENGGAKLRRIEATVTSQAKTGGMFGAIITGGLATMSIKASIAGETAAVTSQGEKLTFYFFFGDSSGANMLGNTGGIGTSPAEFTLVSLNKKKGRRETRVGSRNIAGAKMGVMDKDRLDFSYDLIRPGVYKITPQALKPGEYGFIVSFAGGAADGALSARVFDFGVR